MGSHFVDSSNFGKANAVYSGVSFCRAISHCRVCFAMYSLIREKLSFWRQRVGNSGGETRSACVFKKFLRGQVRAGIFFASHKLKSSAREKSVHSARALVVA